MAAATVHQIQKTLTLSKSWPREARSAAIHPREDRCQHSVLAESEKACIFDMCYWEKRAKACMLTIMEKHLKSTFDLTGFQILVAACSATSEASQSTNLSHRKVSNRSAAPAKGCRFRYSIHTTLAIRTVTRFAGLRCTSVSYLYTFKKHHTAKFTCQ